MHRSFVERRWIDQWLNDPQIVLPKESQERFFKIVRVKEHEEVALFDGQGREITGSLSKAGHLLNPVLREEAADALSIVVLQAALEEAKISETIKRGTEFGAHRFVIFNAERSDPFCWQKLIKREERLKNVAIDAARQSGRLFVPEISFIKDSASWFKDGQVFGCFGDLAATQGLWQMLSENLEKQAEIVVAIGPEGGLSKEEITVLIKAGLQSVRWAPYTLRSELAALGAITLINTALGKF